MEPDPYDVLGLEPGATPEEIRAAFRGLVRSRHPDTATGPSDGSDLRAVLDAYHRLIDPTERERVDRSRRGMPPAGRRRIPVRRSPTGTGSSAAGSLPCPDCRGAGRIRLLHTCTNCGGTGRMAALRLHGPPVVGCPACAGSGRTVAVAACGGCGGSGRRPHPG